ncbi:MAG: hypothetical protein IKC27_05845 [Kiritimatiellae bacterium]|nr:hypothetical protein [Kiritimatiellia bacterium]
MKFLVIVIAFLTSSAYAAKSVLPRPSDDYYGREVSTNAALVLSDDASTRFGLSIELNAETNNNVTVEFGVDADLSGTLSRDEVDVSLGWASGQCFFYNRRSGMLITRDIASGRRKLFWKIKLSSEREAQRLIVNDGFSILFDAPISPSAFNSSWNLVRVAKRGLSFADESVTYSLFNDPFFIIVR